MEEGSEHDLVSACVRLASRGDPSGLIRYGLHGELKQLPSGDKGSTVCFTPELAALAQKVPTEVEGFGLSDAQRVCVADAVWNAKRRVELPIRCNRLLLAKACAVFLQSEGVPCSVNTRDAADYAVRIPRGRWSVVAGQKRRRIEGAVRFVRSSRHSLLSAGIWQDLLHLNLTTHAWMRNHADAVALWPRLLDRFPLKTFVTSVLTRDWLAHWSGRPPRASAFFAVDWGLRCATTADVQACVRAACYDVLYAFASHDLPPGALGSLVFLFRVLPVLENPDCAGPYRAMHGANQLVTHAGSGLIARFGAGASPLVVSARLPFGRSPFGTVDVRQSLARYNLLWGLLCCVSGSVVVVSRRKLPTNAALLSFLFGLRVSLCTRPCEPVPPADNIVVWSRNALREFPNLVWTDGVRRTVPCYELNCL